MRLNTLGGICVIANGGVLAGAAAQPRRLAVLALLARAGRAGATREKILALLWPDEPEDRARRSLNQAVYSLRRELGSDDALLGSKDLRLNLDLIEVDVIEFEDSVLADDVERAVQLYAGPFLEGFSVPRARELDQWIEAERASLALDYAAALERVASRATERGDTNAAVMHWRKLAATDPLNGRIAVSVMNALVAAGDVTGAIQHARLHETLLDQELGLPLDRDVAAFARQLRERATAVAETPRPIVLTPGPSQGTRDVIPSGETDPVASGADSVPVVDREPLVNAPTDKAGTGSTLPSTRRRPRLAAAAAAAVVVVAIAGLLVRGRGASDESGRQPVIAVGTINDYAAPDSSGVARALRDMLATNLARSPELRVVSGSRLLEIERQMNGGKSSIGGAEIVPVARQAGATTLVDGALYNVDADARTLRLDLRVTSLRDGNVLRAYTVTGRDPFILADSATTRLVEYLGSTAPRGSVADGTTHSVAAYRLYEEGLRSYYLGDTESSERFFAAALAQDSAFAMAAYYYALASSRSTREEFVRRLRRAVDLSSRATERERLIIQGGWAEANSLRSLRAIGETLATRYPTEVEGHYYLGRALINAGSYLEALPPLRRVEVMDSLSLRGGLARCAACGALGQQVSVYMLADSQVAAERVARRWLAARPNDWLPWATLGEVLAASGRGDEARAAMLKADSLDVKEDAWESMTTLFTREGQFARADDILRKEIAKGRAGKNAHWFLSISLRYQGRLAEALGEARAYRRATAGREPLTPDAADPSAMGEAQVLRELGRYKEAAALFDSISRFTVSGVDPSAESSGHVWGLTHEAGALAAAGDTSRLAALGDSIEMYGGPTNAGRENRLHYYVRALLFAARGNDSDAVKSFQRAITSPTLAYTRANVDMAKSLLRLRRYREAAGILESALRGGIQGGNFYTTYPEIRLQLAQAYAGLGQRDRANRELDWVRRAWVSADAVVRPQLDSAARVVASRSR